MKNTIKLLAISFIAVMFLVVIMPSKAEAGVCPSLTWGGQSWVTNWSPTTKHLSGTAVFNNWKNLGYKITINWNGPTAGCSSQAAFTKTMNWLYNSDAQTFWNTGLSSWSQNLSCGNTHSYSKVNVPVNGVCGTSNGSTVSTAPASNLCSAGTASSVTSGSNYTWNCVGLYGGSTASCNATKSTTSDVGGNSGGGDSDGDGDGTEETVIPTLSVECRVDSTVPNLGDVVTLRANASGGNGIFTYQWIGTETGSDVTLRVTSNVVKTFVERIKVVSNGLSAESLCGQVVFLARPTIRIEPPIADESGKCNLSWQLSEMLEGATCTVKDEDGVIYNVANGGGPVDQGRKYQVSCEYMIDHDGDITTPVTSTTTVSEIKACVRNPNLIEI